MPLGIFASKSVSLSDWQIRPTETTAVHTANSHKTNIGGVGTPPYVAYACVFSSGILELFEKALGRNNLANVFLNLEKATAA